MTGRRTDSPWLVILALLGAACLTALFATTYIVNLGNPRPHGVPIAVAGTGPIAERAAASLERSGAFDAVRVPTALDARRAIDERDVYAALLPNEGTLVVSEAAGFATSVLVTSALSEEAEKAGRPLAVETVHPLADDDPRGTVMSFFVLALVVGGYIGATVVSVLAGTAPTTLRGGVRRIAALALYAVFAGGLTALVTGPGLGHFAGHRLELTGLAIFVVFAIAAVVAALQIGIGILGSLLAMVVLVWFGSQGSSGAVSWELLPVVTRTLGPFLPAGAGVDAVRGIVYFDGAAIGRDLLVLAGFALVGTAVILVVGRRHGAAAPGDAELAAGAALT